MIIDVDEYKSILCPVNMGSGGHICCKGRRCFAFDTWMAICGMIPKEEVNLVS